MKKLNSSSIPRAHNPNQKNLFLIACSFFLWGIGEGLFFYFQPIYLEQLGAEPLVIGTIFGLNGLVMTLVQTPAGHLCDRLGNRTVMIISWTIGTLATCIMAFSSSLIGFAIGWILYGASVINAATSGYITNVRGKMSVGRALTLVSAMYHLGAFIGPVVGGQIGERFGLYLIYRISVVFFIFSSLIILITRSEATPSTQHEEPRGNLLKIKPFVVLLVISFITIFSGYLAEPFTPNYLQDYHSLSLTEIGKLGSIGSLGNAIVALIFGGIAPFAGILLGHGFLLVYSTLIWRGSNMIWFAIGFFLRGGYRIFQAMYLSVARELFSASEMGFAYGLMATANSLAIILAPPTAGYLYEISPGLIYIVSIILLIVTLTVNHFASRYFKKVTHHPKVIGKQP